MAMQMYSMILSLSLISFSLFLLFMTPSKSPGRSLLHWNGHLGTLNGRLGPLDNYIGPLDGPLELLNDHLRTLNNHLVTQDGHLMPVNCHFWPLNSLYGTWIATLGHYMLTWVL